MTSQHAKDLNHFSEPISEKMRMQLLPAFIDRLTGVVYLSRYANGNLAPIHIHDGLPSTILQRENLNLISGFILNGEFLTHEQAALRLSV